MPADRAASRIVVGIGDDAAAYAALAYAIAEARRNGAELVAVRAWGPPPDPASCGEVSPGSARALRARAAEKVAHAFHEAAGGVPGDITATMQTVEGPPGRALVNHADRPGDLLVIGRSRHSLAHRGVCGSVLDHLMDHAVCRVLVPAAPDPKGRAEEPRADGRPAGISSRTDPSDLFGVQSGLEQRIDGRTSRGLR